MLHEKQTDSFYWKNKLEALDSLPEAVLADKNAAWEKLHHRLQEKKTGNKAIWYWAAAGLLAALVMPWMIANKKENGLVKSIPLQKENRAIPATHMPALQEEPVAVILSALPTKDQPVKKIHGSTAGKNMLTLTGAAPAASKVTAVETIPAPTVNITAPAGVLSSLISIAAVKKQLRVVHINELETPPAINSVQLALSASHEQNNFRFRFGNSHSVNPPPGSLQENTGIVKIPLTN
jgi:hypothetical protein